MALVEINWHPDRKQLRGFGWISLVAFGAIGAWIWFRQSIFGFDLSPPAAERTAVVLWGLAVVCALLGLAAPRALRPLFVGLSLITLPIGFVVSHLVLALLFYGVITPIGIVLRLTGKDLLHRKFETGKDSYWERRAPITDVRRYYRQF